MAAASRALREGNVIAFPTETVYGLGVRAGDPAARRRLSRLKGRSERKPFQVLLNDARQAVERCPKMPPAARRLARAFWPGPLTLVVRDASGRWVGLRVPDHAVARRLAKASGGAILGTSANRSGEPPARTAMEIARTFGDKLAVILDGGAAKIGQASSVVKVGARSWQVLREGALSRAQIEAVINE